MASTFTLGEKYEELLDELVGSGDYGNKSEAVRAALRLLERDRIQWAQLAKAHQDGLDDPRPALSGEEAFARLRKRFTTNVGAGATDETTTAQPKSNRKS